MSISDMANKIISTFFNVKFLFNIKYLPNATRIFLYGITLTFCSLVHAGNLKITTTVDEVKKNDDCSLREAVDFVNANLNDSSHECYPDDKNPSRVIEISTDEVYELKSELNISSSMTIQSNLANDISNQNGKKISTIKVLQGRAFVIDDKSTLKNPALFKLKGIEIQGVFGEDKKSDKNKVVTNEGGLIYNREKLILEKVRLVGGAAGKGGAIYNASIDSSLKVVSSEFVNNAAYQGSAIFSEHEAFVVSKSLFTKNNSLYDNASNALASYVIQTLKAYPNPAIPNQRSDKSYVLRRLGKIANSIFYQNKNIAVLNLLPGVEVNNITAIDNGAGIFLNSGFSYRYFNNQNRPKVIASYLANSVVMNNAAYDVRQNTNDLTFTNHVLVSKDEIFRTKPRNYQTNNTALYNIPTSKLIASLETKDKKGNPKQICAAPSMQETMGLFCPLIKQDDEFVANLKPRLLMTYASISNSPIVNKGVDRTTNNNTDVLECETDDIRGQGRKICDLGAFELSINKKDNVSVKEVNAEIGHGENAFLNLKDISGDGQLIPASQCSLYVANPPRDAKLWLSGQVNVWTDGCVTFLARKYPKKGKLSLAKNKDKLVYKASSNYHGTDEFSYQMVTTTSRFSEAQNDKQITAKTVVYHYPTNEFSNSKANLGYSKGSGSFGIHFLMLLAGMLGLSVFNRRK